MPWQDVYLTSLRTLHLWTPQMIAPDMQGQEMGCTCSSFSDEGYWYTLSPNPKRVERSHSGRRAGQERQGPGIMPRVDLERPGLDWLLEGCTHHPQEVLMTKEQLHHNLPVHSFRLMTVTGNFCYLRPKAANE